MVGVSIGQELPREKVFSLTVDGVPLTGKSNFPGKVN
jgi:hypothetical protein